MGKRYLKIYGHSGRSEDNWDELPKQPVLWAFMMDVAGLETATLDKKMKHRTTDIPAAVDGAILVNALRICANWLPWQASMLGLTFDHQYLHCFYCRSGLDRSVATVVLFCAIVYAAWGITILPQLISFKDGANEGDRQPHTRERPACAKNGRRYKASHRNPCTLCESHSKSDEVWKVISHVLLRETGTAAGDQNLDEHCPARIPARKVLNYFLNFDIRRNAEKLISDLVDKCVTDNMLVEEATVKSTIFLQARSQTKTQRPMQ